MITIIAGVVGLIVFIAIMVWLCMWAAWAERQEEEE